MSSKGSPEKSPGSKSPPTPTNLQKSPDSKRSLSPSKIAKRASVTGIPFAQSSEPKSEDPENDADYYTRPDFIYGGPFIAVKLPSPFLDTGPPINIPLQGTFRQSFAYFSLKERLPVILTKIIDYLSRDGAKIATQNSATADEVRRFIESIAKLKNDLVTNKNYDTFTLDTPEAAKWNRWIENQENKKYFQNSWMFTECYVYRKLRESCELTKGLKNFDYFEEQKNQSFENNLEVMCLVADKMVTMIKKSEKDKRKADFVTLLKICLWANKCDLSQSLGSQVDLIQAAKDTTERLRLNQPPLPPGKGKKAKKAAPAGPIIISSDPFQMILDLKDKVLVDDANKIADQVVTKAENMLKSVAAAQNSGVFKAKCSCNRLAKNAGIPICVDPNPPEPAPEPPKEPAPAAPKEKKIPCPAKLTVPQAVMFDIVCDNAGYELFADLCLAHFLIAQQIVQKVRFHVKNMPWFISDVTIKDFQYVINACSKSQFSKPSSTGATEGEGGKPKTITAVNLKTLGEQWSKFVEEGVFIVVAEDFWTYPHCYKDMKKIDVHLYRKLQNAVAVMFKGDLNYRKLMGDVYCNPYLGFQAALQGFLPAPIIAVRTVKSETICGLPKNKLASLAHDPKWMQSGDYGVVQFCPKGEALKVSDRPCIHYCTTCFGLVCPDEPNI